MLKWITPVLLTYNEENNIGRTLSQLQWASDIVVVDSGSTDNTLKVLDSFDPVRVYHRDFDTHANQWQFAISQTAINTHWILAMDADYLLSDELISELKNLEVQDQTNGFTIPFKYCINGKPIRSSLYHPVLMLYRIKFVHYIQHGHTQRAQVEGEVLQLQSHVYHDDRKPFKSWMRSQLKYADLEAKLIKREPWNNLSSPNKLRKMILITPVLVPLYILLVDGGILNGYRGIKYAGERLIAEALLSYYLLFK